MRITHGFHPGIATPTAVTAGNFDGVHRGHQAMLERLSREAHAMGLEAVAVTFEPHPREWFGGDDVPARLSSLRDKLAIMHRCGIDHVHICPFNARLAAMSARQFVEDMLLAGLCMRHLLIGDDFRFGARREGDFALLSLLGQQHGYSVEAMDSVVVAAQRISSTAIRTALASGDFATAAQLLGRPFCISGHVMHGDKRGRTIGFPTANLALNRRRLPLSGVFCARVSGSGLNAVPAVVNVGMRPTVQSTQQPRLETHLLDFSADLYGRIIEVEFVAKLRDEQKFSDLALLRQQIARDVARAREHFNLIAPSLPA
ncbi:MAG: bifunctional riboflavin kinase/FAD synthetase [Betaproteobacteria bacterium]|nr:bifunctional riboflavin kinase/FAD synthetase [Betaproteobacteria bacterium]